MNKNYWFVNKTYGWGWTPATWQGWLVLATYLLAVAFFFLNIQEHMSAREVILRIALPIVLFTIALIVVCYKTGERPRWQWGEVKKK